MDFSHEDGDSEDSNISSSQFSLVEEEEEEEEGGKNKTAVIKSFRHNRH